MNLAFTSPLTLAQLIRQKEISPFELTEFFVQRIEKFDGQLGSFHHVMAEQALEEGRKKTDILTQSNDLTEFPPFFGVPTAIKDLNPVSGMPCSYGVSALKDQIAEYDDAVTAKIKGAGFIILGKTATSQLGSFPYSEPPGFLPSRNPWNLDYTAGGSSGGAAAAVSAGLCPVTQGSDGGGSIRTPASCCGLVGIKPSRGRVSNAPVGDYQSGIATNGTLGRTVADAAALLDVISGYVVGDPYWLPDPKTSYSLACQQDPPPLRIALAETLVPFQMPTAPIQNSLREVGQQLANLGHEVEIEVFDAAVELISPFTKVWQAGIPAAGIPSPALSPLNQWLGERAGSAGDYLQSVTKMQVISRKIIAFVQQYDALLLPVHLHAPPKVGEWTALSPEETVTKIINWIAPCPPFNASGLPAIAVPVGFDPQGLPIGVQLVGNPAQEGVLISLAAQLERLRGTFPLPSHFSDQ
ncbi:MAG: amidase [Microcystaceae cyanobacterium]